MASDAPRDHRAHPGYEEGAAHRGRRRGDARLPARRRRRRRLDRRHGRARRGRRRDGPAPGPQRRQGRGAACAASGTPSTPARTRSSPSTPTASTTRPRSPRSSPRSTRRGPELIIGQRDFGEMPPVRRLSNTLGGATLSAALGQGVPDNQSGYRLIGRQLMRALLDERRVGLRVRGRDDRPLHRPGPARSRGCRSGRSTPASPVAHPAVATTSREFLRVTRKARRIARGG